VNNTHLNTPSLRGARRRRSNPIRRCLRLLRPSPVIADRARNDAYFTEDFFYKALIISLSVHLLLVCSSLFIQTRPIKKMRINKMEVIYTAHKKAETQVPKDKPADSKPTKNDKITPQDPLASGVLIKERNEQPETLKIYERVPDKNRSLNMAMKKTVSVPVLQSEKINNPTYANYYSLVRGRIRQRAYFNYSEYYAGEVYLTFILTSDGTLKELKIIEERTTGGQYLRTIGLKSIKEADPFPPFPKDLRYPELTFNVVISFQVHEQ